MAIEEVGASPAQASSFGAVPPPPAEVKVRTMKSDYEALMKSGGASPSFRTVTVEGLSLAKSQTGPAAPKRMIERIPGLVWGILAIAIVVFGLIIWFGYAVFAKH